MNKIRVLVAEDDADDRYIFDTFLKDREDIEMLPYAEHGIEVFSFLDAQAITDLPDMIILDHNMPKMNGRQTLRLLKQNHRYAAIPVFVYSTYADPELISYCIAQGATRVVTKPTDYDGYQDLMTSFIQAITHVAQ